MAVPKQSIKSKSEKSNQIENQIACETMDWMKSIALLVALNHIAIFVIIMNLFYMIIFCFVSSIQTWMLETDLISYIFILPSRRGSFNQMKTYILICINFNWWRTKNCSREISLMQSFKWIIMGKLTAKLNLNRMRYRDHNQTTFE